MGRDIVKWVGAVLAVGGTAAFVYGLIVLVSNGSCGCSGDGFCSGPPCPPADNFGFLGLFAGIWVAIAGIIMMSAAASRAKVAKWRAQLAAGTGPYGGSRLVTSAVAPASPGLTFASMGGAFAAGAGVQATPGGFAMPGAQGPAPGSAEAILAADAQAGVPSTPAPQGDATGRLQELDALHTSGVVNDAEYATQRQRILDSI